MRNLFVPVLVGVLYMCPAASAPASTVIVYTAGLEDNFAEPADLAAPSTLFADWIMANYPSSLTDFDVVAENLHRGHTFLDLKGPNEVIVAATIEFRVAFAIGAASENDDLQISFIDGINNVEVAYRRSYAELEMLIGGGDGDGTWDLDDDAIFTVDLANPPVWNEPWYTPIPPEVGEDYAPDLLALMNHYGFVDVAVADDSAVEYLKLTITTQEIPEPASMTLVALVGMCLLIRRKNK